MIMISYVEIHGIVVRRLFDYNTTNYFTYCSQELSKPNYNTLLWSGTIDSNPYEIGESVYIDVLKQPVKIMSMVRLQSGGYKYKSDYVIATLDDEITKESFEEAKEKETKHIDKLIKGYREMQDILANSNGRKNWIKL